MFSKYQLKCRDSELANLPCHPATDRIRLVLGVRILNVAASVADRIKTYFSYMKKAENEGNHYKKQDVGRLKGILITVDTLNFLIAPESSCFR